MCDKVFSKLQIFTEHIRTSSTSQCQHILQGWQIGPTRSQIDYNWGQIRLKLVIWLYQ